MANIKLNVGDFFRVTKMNNDIPEGTILQYNASGYGVTQEEIRTAGGSLWIKGTQLSFSMSYVEKLNRKERGKVMVKNGRAMVEAGQELISRGKALEMYETDEEELAATMVKILDTSGTTEERIVNIAKLLKSRDTSSML